MTRNGGIFRSMGVRGYVSESSGNFIVVAWEVDVAVVFVEGGRYRDHE